MDLLKDPTTLFIFKLVITFGLMASGFFVNRALSWSLRKLHPYHPEKARSQLVFFKNLVRMAVFLLLVSVWASQITGAFLSVVAIAGALIITGKEVVLGLLGYVNISLSKPFRIGDYIEIGNQNGRVIDIDLLSTKLFEIGMSGKYTGRRLSVPNAAVFMNTIKHNSMLGKFSLYTIEIILPFKADTVRAEEVALRVARTVSAAWVEEADQYFDRIEVSEFVDLPAAHPEVFWQAYNELAHKMIVRLACPLEKRGDAEQAIYKGFWREFGPV
ncbi:MAG TPA: mechanosensitive ion channel domain-containing protein [Limnobacter sp.]|nr:mechanosensitive ion channel domain-containing protein [Limnobacter sp.]